LAGETVRFDRVQRLPHGGNADISVTYVPRHDEGGRVEGFYALVTDISELKRLDRMKSEFVSTVSHELRTPLTSIRGSLGLLSGGVAGVLPEKASSLVDIAKNNCERLIRLINDILDIEKIESGTIVFSVRMLDLADIIDHAIRANEGYAAQHHVRLRVIASPDAAKVSGDQDRLIQVLTNLISNACKFSPAESSVDIAVTREEKSFKVAVIDHGPGISEEFRKRIFQRFSQADSSDARQKGGTGLGLSISKAIVERLGGKIGFDSEPGKGTSFHFTLPERVESASIAPMGETKSAGRPRILICEDDPDVGRLLQLLLDNAGFDSHIARTSAEAKSLAGKIGYAAMTVDLRLPDEDGLALVRSLRAEPATRDLPIVVVSAWAEEGRLKLGAENLGVVDWLSKPIDEPRLIANLRHSTSHGGRVRLLHVEDDADVRRIVAALARDFADCESAETLGQAKARIENGVFDVILLDLGLPDGSGWELLPLVSRLDPRPRVVIFSAQNASDEANPLVQAVLVKSLTSESQLVETLRNLAFQEA
jgi:signal transduction histidine kinase/DNA-binding response OmpR family regulator